MQIGTFRALSSSSHLVLTPNGTLLALGIDRETLCPPASAPGACILTLEALLMGTPGAQSSASAGGAGSSSGLGSGFGLGVEDVPLEVQVRVVDLDDSWPAWVEQRTWLTIAESASNGSSVLVARVLDPDLRLPHQSPHLQHTNLGAPPIRTRLTLGKQSSASASVLSPALAPYPTPGNTTFELSDTHGAFALALVEKHVVQQQNSSSSGGSSDAQTHVELYLQLVRPLDRETRDTYTPRLCMRALPPLHRDPRRDSKDKGWEPERNTSNTAYRNCLNLTGTSTGGHLNIKVSTFSRLALAFANKICVHQNWILDQALSYFQL